MITKVLLKILKIKKKKKKKKNCKIKPVCLCRSIKVYK